jgi:hypothetical protein
LANNFIAREHNKDEEMLKRNAKACFDFGSVIEGYVTQEFFLLSGLGEHFKTVGITWLQTGNQL